MRRMLSRLAVFTLAATLSAQVVSAQVFAGTTVGGPTWNRPLNGSPPDGLSAVGTNVAFDFFRIQVTQAGDYDFLSEATDPAPWDNLLFLYQGSFDPNDPLANVLIGDDPFPNIGFPGFTAALNVGIDYFLVTTGFTNDDTGAYELQISGPGTAFVPGVAVPEPGTLALLAVGLIGVATARRRTT